MTMTRSTEGRERKFVFLLVLLGHCVLIYLIGWSIPAHRPPTQILYEPFAVFFIDSRKPKMEPAASSDLAPEKAQTKAARPQAPPPANLPAQPAPDSMQSNAITDWYGQAQSVVEDAVEKERKKAAQRAFEHRAAPAEKQEGESIFDPLPVRRAGTWAGRNSYYVTDNCHFDFDPAPPPPPTRLDNRLKTAVCDHKPRGGGADMFKELAPDYLKKPRISPYHPP